MAEDPTEQDSKIAINEGTEIPKFRSVDGNALEMYYRDKVDCVEVQGRPTQQPSTNFKLSLHYSIGMCSREKIHRAKQKFWTNSISGRNKRNFC